MSLEWPFDYLIFSNLIFRLVIDCWTNIKVYFSEELSESLCRFSLVRLSCQKSELPRGYFRFTLWVILISN